MDTETSSLPRQFFEELKRRRVIRVATLYVLALWPVIQIVDILSPAIELPPTTMRYLLILFVGGLPVALILSWLYDLNRGGIVRAGTAEGGRDHPLVGRSVEITVVSVLVLAVTVLFVLQSTMEFDAPASDPARTGLDTGFSSIAVLPFVSFSESREDELFADGLTEELLNVLSRIKDLRVIARTTSFAYKGVNRNVQDIGRELNVNTILEGSVRRNDLENTIRVTAQLIDTESGTHLWSNAFDREFRDIFRIQDEIAAAVLRQLNLTLAEEEARRLQSRSTRSPEAMVAYGMGRTAIGRRTDQALRDAERYFKQAIEFDPEYADAHAELANTYSLQGEFQPARREVLLQAAQQEIDNSMALDPDNGAAWAALGLLRMMRAESDPAYTEPAREALARAIELNPSLPMANMWYGNLSEDPRERQRYHALAFELDPRSPVAGYNLASDLVLAGRESDAMEIFSRIVDADPNYPGAYQLIAQMNQLRGRLGEAIRSYEKVYSLHPTSPVAAKLATLWVDIGDFERADQWIQRAEEDPLPTMEDDLSWLRISASIARGDRPTAEEIMQPMLESSAGDPAALLNAARAGYFLGDYQTAVTSFETLSAMGRPKPGPHDTDLLETRVATAYAYRQLGRESRAQEMLKLAEDRIGGLLSHESRANPNLWYILAQISAIRDQNNRALIQLQRAVDEGWRQHWRPAVEPSLSLLVKEPAFTAMMQGLTTRMDLIRDQIAFDESIDSDWET